MVNKGGQPRVAVLPEPAPRDIPSAMTAPKTHQTKTYVLVFLLVLLGSVGNTILSKGMKDTGDLDISHVATLAAGAARVLTSGTIWLGIAMMLGFMICHMLVLSWADYSFVMPFSAIAYALVPLLGYLFLHEQVSTARWIGIVLIVLGVVLINRTPHRTTAPENAN
jgi:multidrug transporter EmrE-like cation transporter